MNRIHNKFRWLALMVMGVISTLSIQAQEIGQLSFFNQTHYIWNPAFTAIQSNMEAQILFRQQWVSLPGAPQSGYAGIQKNVGGANMGLGGVLILDRSGPVNKNGVQLNYSYRLREAFGENTLLAIGLSGSISQLTFDSRSEIYNDEGDRLIDLMPNSAIFPTLNFGFVFLSDTDLVPTTTSYYVGASVQQFYSSNVLLMESDFSRERHIYLNAGMKIPMDESIIEPYLAVNYVRPSLVDIQIAAKYELQDYFWVGLGYSNISEATLYGGVIVNDFINRGSVLRLGALGNYGLGSIASDLGPGFEFFLNYSVNIDQFY